MPTYARYPQLNVDTERIYDIGYHVWRQYPHIWAHTQCLQFRPVGFKPPLQRVYADTGLIRQLLFTHCFHKNFVIKLMTDDSSDTRI